MMKIVCGAQSDLLWFYSMFTICFCTPIWTGPPIKTDVPTLWPHCVPHSQPISFKMGVFDGVYKLDMTQADPNWAALHKEMGKRGANAVGARIGKKPPRYP